MQTLIDSFTFFNQHPSLMWSKTLAHLAISFASLTPFLLNGRSKSRTSESCSALA